MGGTTTGTTGAWDQLASAAGCSTGTIADQTTGTTGETTGGTGSTKQEVLWAVLPPAPPVPDSSQPELEQRYYRCFHRYYR